MGRSPTAPKKAGRMNVLYQGFHCLCRGGPEFRVERPVTPQVTSPLVVFSEDFATRKKVELVMKMDAGTEGYEVKDTAGYPWLRVERKAKAKWNERIVSDMNGDPVCMIERQPKSGKFKVWSLMEEDPELVMEVRERRSFKASLTKERKEELKATLQGDDWEVRPCLRVHGQLHNRFYGITWTDDHGNNDTVVAMSWGAAERNESPPKNNGKGWFVMELPAGVDAALMVALAVIVDERDFSKNPPPRMALPPHTSQPVIGFGENYVSESGTIVALSMEHDRLNVTDGVGQSLLTCGADGIFTNTNGRHVFELTNGGFCMQGLSESNSPVGMSFSKSGGDGSSVNLSMLFCTEPHRRQSQELMAVIDPNEATIPLYAVQEGESLGTPIAQAVLGNQNPDDFEQWFYGAMDRLCVTQNVEADPFVHVGIGAEVAAGVDVALVVAAMLLVVKFLPAAMSSKPMLGVIHPSGIVRWDGLQWMLDENPVSVLLSQCGLDHFGSQVKVVE